MRLDRVVRHITLCREQRTTSQLQQYRAFTAITHNAPRRLLSFIFRCFAYGAQQRCRLSVLHPHVQETRRHNKRNEEPKRHRGALRRRLRETNHAHKTPTDERR